MPARRHRSQPPRAFVAIGAAFLLALGFVACGADVEGTSAPGTSSADAVEVADLVDLYDTSKVHEITVIFDQAEYDAMVTVYAESQEKEWIEADVSINGERYAQAGMRLKGNSSLFGLQPVSEGAEDVETTETTAPAGGGAPRLPIGPGGGVSADEPEALPWLISLDKNVDGQSYGGVTELVVRSSATETALNEAVALELLAEAGLATQRSTHVRFSVNGSDPALRLVIENPNDAWDADNFEGDGILYKAEAGGDWSYRGDDADAYKDVFDQETRKDDENLKPLTDFLDFVNNSDDATFAAGLGERLDVEAFADYLVFEELVGNFDDIDGPGNNAYLRFDEESGRFTVVAWDHNLSFGAMGAMMAGGFPGGGAGGPAAPPPDGAEAPAPPTDPSAPPGGQPQVPPGGFPGGGFPGGGFPGGGGFASMGQNPLVNRFKANETFLALYEQAKTELRESLFTSGTAKEIVDRRAALLLADATDLVDAATVEAEANTIREMVAAP